jgi:hypothetical protein
MEQPFACTIARDRRDTQAGAIVTPDAPIVAVSERFDILVCPAICHAQVVDSRSSK